MPLHILCRYKSKIASVLLAILCLNFYTPVVVAIAKPQPSKNVYISLERTHLPSLARQLMEEDLVQEDTKKANAELVKQNKLNKVVVPQLGASEKVKLAYKILSQSSSGTAADATVATLSDTVISDLELLCGPNNNPEKHVFGNLDLAEMATGKIELQRMLVHPLTDLKSLQDRQACIRVLAEDDKVFAQVQEHVATLRNLEHEFIWFWKELEEEVQSYFNQAYPGVFSVHKNASTLQFSSLWTAVFSPTLRAIWPTSIAIGASYMLHKYLHEAQAAGHNGMLQHIVRERGYQPDNITFINCFKAFLSLVSELFLQIPIMGEFRVYDNNGAVVVRQAPREHRITMGIITAIGLTPYLWILYNGIQASANFNTLSNQIHDKMNKAATYTSTLESLGTLVAAHPKLKDCFPEHQTLLKLTQTPSEEANELTELLKSDTFKAEPSFFAHKGRALAAFKMMFDSKNNFIDGMQAAGKMNAYLSVARLYRTYKDHPNAKYCFVDFKETATPYLKLENFWHPSINPDIVVTNSLEVGGNGQAGNIIITGPNAGGKSTALKSIVLAILLAQSFGIAPASYMALSPFARITTYLNIADSTGSESLFQAEVARAQSLLTALGSLKPGQFSFAIMDEIFTGTNPEEGQAGAYGVAKNLASFSNSMCIVATHFKKLTELATHTNGKYKNCKVSVIINPDGTIKPEYKLKDGISDQKIALQMLNNAGFGESIMQDAYAVLNEKKQ